MSERREPVAYHEVKWTPDAIRTFWDYQGGNSAAEDSYFSKKFARRIVGLAERHVSLAGTIVDVGCGPGFLVEEMMRRGYSVRAVDGSPRTIERLAGRLAGRPGFAGAEVGEAGAIPLGDAEAGAVFLVEVLEHLTPDAAERALREVARVVRPGGVLIATTPHQEDLDARKVACPECGCVFHRVQHLQQMDAPLLTQMLESSGFEPVFVRALNFRHFPHLRIGPLVRLVTRTVPALGGADLPHLVAIARRRSP